MNKTKVIFRVSKWEVLAVFPGLPGTSDYYDTCLCYASVGQHSGMSMEFYKNCTRPAKYEEYSDLKAELELLGYDLQIAKRATYKDFLARKQQTRG